MNGRPMGRDDRRRPQGGMRINHRIRVPEVRVIMDEGEQLRPANTLGIDLRVKRMVRRGHCLPWRLPFSMGSARAARTIDGRRPAHDQ